MFKKKMLIPIALGLVLTLTACAIDDGDIEPVDPGETSPPTEDMPEPDIPGEDTLEQNLPGDDGEEASP